MEQSQSGCFGVFFSQRGFRLLNYSVQGAKWVRRKRSRRNMIQHWKFEWKTLPDVVFNSTVPSLHVSCVLCLTSYPSPSLHCLWMKLDEGQIFHPSVCFRTAPVLQGVPALFTHTQQPCSFSHNHFGSAAHWGKFSEFSAIYLKLVHCWAKDLREGESNFIHTMKLSASEHTAAAKIKHINGKGFQLCRRSMSQQSPVQSFDFHKFRF